MKKLLTLLFVFAFIIAQSQIVVNLRDNSKLQFAGSAVKMKGIVTGFNLESTGDFIIEVTVQYYQSNAGAYGAYIPTTITEDIALSAEEKFLLLTVYGDKIVRYSTIGKWVNASGDVVPAGTPGATTELAYWQSFKLNQVAGVVSISATGAMQAMYLTITAIVNQMNIRKNW